MPQHSRSVVINSALRPDGRVLTNTEQQFYCWTLNEAQAIAFAKHVTLPEHASDEFIENVVILILLKAKEAADGEPTRVEFVCGHRRDLWRMQ